jgi:peptidyl-prolyl cis-trans isomerase C
VKTKSWILLACTVLLAACGNISGNTVARFDSLVLTRQEVDTRVARVEKGFQAQAASGMQMPSKLDIERQVVEQFINQQLVLAIAKERGISVSDQEIDTQLDQFETAIPQATGGTLDDAVQNQLGLPGAESTEFRQFVSYVLAQQKIGETLVTTDTVRTRVTDQVMTQAKQEVEQATVAHILVATEEEARAVVERLDKGEDFAALAKELSTDPGSKDNGGVYENITRGEFVPEFEQAMFEDLEPGEITRDPVQTQFGYHVIKLISRSTGPAMTDEQAQMEIEQQIPNALQQARAEATQALIEQERAKALQANRLEEPTYPTPTVPAGQPAPTAQP